MKSVPKKWAPSNQPCPKVPKAKVVYGGDIRRVCTNRKGHRGPCNWRFLANT